jgi:hypothetical protein
MKTVLVLQSISMEQSSMMKGNFCMISSIFTFSKKFSIHKKKDLLKENSTSSPGQQRLGHSQAICF